MLLKITVPDDNTRVPTYMEQVLDALHQHNRRRDPVTLSFAKHVDQVGLFCNVPESLRTTVENGLQAAYDGCEVKELEPSALAFNTAHECFAFSLTLRPDVLPLHGILRFHDRLNYEFTDPISGILDRLHHRTIAARIDLIVRPASRWRCFIARRTVETLDRPLLADHPLLFRWFALQATASRWWLRWPAHIIGLVLRKTRSRRQVDTTKEKVRGHSLSAVELQICVSSSGDDCEAAREHAHAVAASFAAFSQDGIVEWKLSEGTRTRPFLLSTQELALLWHLPNHTVRARSLQTTESRRLEPPVGLPSREADTGQPVLELGETCFQDRFERFGLLPDDRLRHVYVVGKTGMGKSSLLINMVQSDMLQGHGVCLIDPHGDLAYDALNLVPPSRYQDAIVLNAGDRSAPLGFNPLLCERVEDRPLVADGVLSSFKKVFGLTERDAPRLLYILRISLLTLLERPGTTLIDLDLLLTNSAYRNLAVKGLGDGPVRSFWQNEFQRLPQREKAIAVSAILNKVKTYATSPFLRLILGHSDSRLRIREVMDQRRILIVNLSKGRMGADASNLLGALLISSLEVAAMSRADTDHDQRSPFYAYIDEFHNFATESFAGMLSEARKFELGLTLANQYLDQLDRETRTAVLGNVGNVVSFQVGPEDSEILSRQLGGRVTQDDLQRLPRFTAYARVLVNNSATQPFSMRTIRPPKISDASVADKVKRVSDRQYACRSGREIEQEICRMYR